MYNNAKQTKEAIIENNENMQKFADRGVVSQEDIDKLKQMWLDSFEKVCGEE